MILYNFLRKHHHTGLPSGTEYAEDSRDPFLHLIRNLPQTLSASIPAIAEAGGVLPPLVVPVLTVQEFKKLISDRHTITSAFNKVLIR